MYVKRNVGEKKIKIKLKIKSYRVIREQTGQCLRTCVYNVSEKKKEVKFSESRDEHTKINVTSLYSVYWEEICQKLFNEQ